MKKPKWDTELGRLLWLEGKCDGEIADAFGIAISTVTAYRKRHWEKMLIQAEDAPAVEETKDSATPPKTTRRKKLCMKITLRPLPVVNSAAKIRCPRTEIGWLTYTKFWRPQPAV